MNKMILALAFASSLAYADTAVVFYPQAQGLQLIYKNAYVGYSNKDKDVTIHKVDKCFEGTCASIEREWFDYNVQAGFVVPTNYGVSPFAGLTYSNDKSHEDRYVNSEFTQSYEHSHDTVGFEAGVLYEFYPHAVAGLKFTTQYEELQFGLGYKF